MKKELNFGVNFHGSFPPEPEYIARVLAISDGTPRTVSEVSQITGIPQGKSTGKAKPHLSYAAMMGLINGDLSAPKRTALGELIYEEDPACEEPLTQYILHTRLCSCETSNMWNVFVRDILLNNHGSVAREYAVMRLTTTFNCSSKSLSPLLSTYTKQLRAIDYLGESSERVWVNKKQPFNEYLYLYGYELLREWEASQPGESELTLPIVYALGCAICFGLDDAAWFEVLERLTEAHIIRLNKQLTPCTVVALTTSESLLDKLYSLLL